MTSTMLSKQPNLDIIEELEIEKDLERLNVMRTKILGIIAKESIVKIPIFIIDYMKYKEKNAGKEEDIKDYRKNASKEIKILCQTIIENPKNVLMDASGRAIAKTTVTTLTIATSLHFITALNKSIEIIKAITTNVDESDALLALENIFKDKFQPFFQKVISYGEDYVKHTVDTVLRDREKVEKVGWKVLNQHIVSSTDDLLTTIVYILGILAIVLLIKYFYNYYLTRKHTKNLKAITATYPKTKLDISNLLRFINKKKSCKKIGKKSCKKSSKKSCKKSGKKSKKIKQNVD